eukprot:m.62187 g.62187  ORF g.62187 m.62187 type:complete len:849 (+) comp7389_c0_seq1:129-2675(+)
MGRLPRGAGLLAVVAAVVAVAVVVAAPIAASDEIAAQLARVEHELAVQRNVSAEFSQLLDAAEQAQETARRVDGDNEELLADLERDYLSAETNKVQVMKKISQLENDRLALLNQAAIAAEASESNAAPAEEQQEEEEEDDEEQGAAGAAQKSAPEVAQEVEEQLSEEASTEAHSAEQAHADSSQSVSPKEPRGPASSSHLSLSETAAAAETKAGDTNHAEGAPEMLGGAAEVVDTPEELAEDEAKEEAMENGERIVWEKTGHDTKSEAGPEEGESALVHQFAHHGRHHRNGTHHGGGLGSFDPAKIPHRSEHASAEHDASAAHAGGLGPEETGVFDEGEDDDEKVHEAQQQQQQEAADESNLQTAGQEVGAGGSELEASNATGSDVQLDGYDDAAVEGFTNDDEVQQSQEAPKGDGAVGNGNPDHHDDDDAFSDDDDGETGGANAGSEAAAEGQTNIVGSLDDSLDSQDDAMEERQQNAESNHFDTEEFESEAGSEHGAAPASAEHDADPVASATVHSDEGKNRVGLEPSSANRNKWNEQTEPPQSMSTTPNEQDRWDEERANEDGGTAEHESQSFGHQAAEHDDDDDAEKSASEEQNSFLDDYDEQGGNDGDDDDDENDNANRFGGEEENGYGAESEEEDGYGAEGEEEDSYNAADEYADDAEEAAPLSTDKPGYELPSKYDDGKSEPEGIAPSHTKDLNTEREGAISSILHHKNPHKEDGASSPRNTADALLERNCLETSCTHFRQCPGGYTCEHFRCCPTSHRTNVEGLHEYDSLNPLQTSSQLERSNELEAVESSSSSFLYMLIIVAMLAGVGYVYRRTILRFALGGKASRGYQRVPVSSFKGV